MTKANINIDYLKCTSPEDCRKCLGTCQPVVLALTFSDEDYHNPKDWKILPAFPSLCMFCNFCVEECPEKAISILIK